MSICYQWFAFTRSVGEWQMWPSTKETFRIHTKEQGEGVVEDVKGGAKVEGQHLPPASVMGQQPLSYYLHLVKSSLSKDVFADCACVCSHESVMTYYWSLMNGHPHDRVNMFVLKCLHDPIKDICQRAPVTVRFN